MHVHLAHFIRWTLRLVLPLTLMGMLFIPLLGPRPLEDAAALRSTFADDVPLLVGTGANRSTYVLWPSVLSNPRLVTVHGSVGASPRIEQSRAGFVLWAGFLLLCAIGTWWVWRRRSSPPERPSRPGPLRGSR